MNAQQGHLYRYGPSDVLALSSGPKPRVALLLANEFWPLGKAFVVDASLLKPQPMRYFHGAVPA